MTAMRFVDTNVALYAVSARPIEAAKRQVSLDLLSESYGSLALSVQVIGEFYYQATWPSRTDALSHEEAAEVVEDLTGFTWNPSPLKPSVGRSHTGRDTDSITGTALYSRRPSRAGARQFFPRTWVQAKITTVLGSSILLSRNTESWWHLSDYDRN